MSTIVIASEIDVPPLEIPGGIASLTDFRRWVFSKSFPETGRIDYIDGRIEVDMAADDLFVHNLPKTELTATLHHLVKERELGWLFCDGARISCPEAELSAEPDVVFIAKESYERGRTTFRKSKSRSHPGYVEIVGPADLVVEVVSDSSVRKDTRLLPDAYFRSGVEEFWLLDCRGNDVSFEISVRGPKKFKAVKVEADGYRRSTILNAAFRLSRKRAGAGMWRYDLDVR